MKTVARVKSRLYNPYWIAFTIVLCIIAAVVGYPAFHRKFGFPAALLWMAVVILGIWMTYFIRAYFFSNDHNK